MNFKKIFIAIIILFGIRFYHLQVLAPISNTLKVAGIIMIFWIIFFYRPTKLLSPSKKYLNLYIVGLLLSVFACYVFWKQPFVLSILSLKSYWFLLIYYALHKLKPTVQEIYDVISLIGIGYVFAYLISFAMYPDHFFGEYSSLRRGTITFLFPGSIFNVFNIFRYSYLIFYKKRRRKTDIVLLILFVLVVLLQAGRNQMLAVLLSPLFYYLKSVNFSAKKIFNQIILSLFIFIIFLSFQEIFYSIFDKTYIDFQAGKNNIRILSANYYIFEHSPSIWNILFGNGMFNGDSEYGDFIMNTLWTEYGFYAEDIGLIGFWSYFGTFTLVIYFYMLSIFFKNHNPLFFKMFAFYLVLMSLATFDSYEPDSLILQAILLYISDMYFNQKHHKKAYP